MCTPPSCAACQFVQIVLPAGQSFASFRAPMSEISLLIATRNAHKAGEIRAILGDRFRFLTLNDFPEAPEGGRRRTDVCRQRHEERPWNWRSGWSANPVNLSTRQLVNAICPGRRFGPGSGRAERRAGRAFGAVRRAGSERGRLVREFTPDADNNAKLLRLLKDVPLEKRTARFHCVIALTPVLPEKVEVASPVCYADEFEMQTELFDGVCEGRMLFEPRGTKWFRLRPVVRAGRV